MQNEYPVSQISRLRIDIDGEGIRTLVLFQGCPLKCRYCINSFTWDKSEMPLMMSAQKIYNSILLDRPYMLATGGGVTFGGGEPLLHSKAIREFAELDKNQFTIFVQTSLNVPRENIDEILEVVDKYYVDIKTMNQDKYHEYTNGTLEVVLQNLQYLLDHVGGDKIVVRIPRIPGMTSVDDQKSYQIELERMGFQIFDLFEYLIPV